MKFSSLIGWIKINLASLIAAFCGFILICLYTNYGGIGISPDSVAYISAARNIVNGNGFYELGGLPLVAFPVVYPLYLASVMGITQTDIIRCAPVLNGLMFALLIFLAGIMIDKLKFTTKWYKIALLLLISFSPFLQEIYLMMWSETLFILLSAIFFLALNRYFSKRNYLSLFLVSIVTAVAFDARFAGVTLVALGAVLIFSNKKIKWSSKLKHLFIFLFISCSLVAINLIRNHLVSPNVTGPRQKGVTPLSVNFGYASDIVSQWISLNVVLQIEIAFCVFVFVFFLWQIARKWRESDSISLENVIMVFFVIYVSFIVITSTISRYEKINNRLLSPAYIPFLLGIAVLIQKFGEQFRGRKKWIFSSLVIVLFLYVGIVYGNNEVTNYSDMSDGGVPGYTDDDWRESPTIRFLQKDREYFNPDSAIYSNHSPAVYLYTNYAVDALPEKAYKNDIRMFMDDSPLILIWFTNEPNNDLITMDEIRKKKDVKILHRFSDGFIYVMTNKTGRKLYHHHKRRRHLYHHHRYSPAKVLDVRPDSIS